MTTEEKSRCLNCEASLSGPFCAQCGQKTLNLKIGFLDLMRSYLGDAFAWDSRLWTTLTTMFRSPGAVEQAYLSGKRQRFIPPMRLYLLSTFLFFALNYWIGQDSIRFQREESSAQSVQNQGIHWGQQVNITISQPQEGDQPESHPTPEASASPSSWRERFHRNLDQMGENPAPWLSRFQ